MVRHKKIIISTYIGILFSSFLIFIALPTQSALADDDQTFPIAWNGGYDSDCVVDTKELIAYRRVEGHHTKHGSVWSVTGHAVPQASTNKTLYIDDSIINSYLKNGNIVSENYISHERGNQGRLFLEVNGGLCTDPVRVVGTSLNFVYYSGASGDAAGRARWFDCKSRNGNEAATLTCDKSVATIIAANVGVTDSDIQKRLDARSKLQVPMVAALANHYQDNGGEDASNLWRVARLCISRELIEIFSTPGDSSVAKSKANWKQCLEAKFVDAPGRDKLTTESVALLWEALDIAFGETQEAREDAIETAEDTKASAWDEDGGNKKPDPCSLDGIGWIVCPVLTLVAGLADKAFGILAKFMAVPVAITKDGDVTYKFWQAFRNLANVAFIIGFLIIVFSQITSIGFSNYSIKKIFPRLIVSAVLVNVSFWICALAVDISNILGYSIGDFADSIIAGVDTKVSKMNNWHSTSGGFWGWIVALVIIGAGGVAFMGSLTLLIPILIGFLVAVLSVLFFLMVRQAVIIMLIILSPLAFCAYLLPNTESWFKKWWNTFKTMLLVFPIIALLFAGGKIAASVLQAVGAGGTGEDDPSLMIQLMGAAAMVLPLFLIPSTLKKVSGMLNGLAGKMQGLGGAAKGKVANTRAMKHLAQKSAEHNARVGAGSYRGKNPVSKLKSVANRGINKMTGDYGRRRSLGDMDANAKQVATEEALFDRGYANATNKDAFVQKEFSKAVQSGNLSKAQAISNNLSQFEGGREQLSAAIGSVGNMGGGAFENGLRSHIAKTVKKENNAGLNGWGTGAASTNEHKSYQNLTAQQRAGQSAANVGAHMNPLHNEEFVDQSNGKVKNQDKLEEAQLEAMSQADAVLGNKELASTLTPEQRAEHEAISNGVVSPSQKAKLQNETHDQANKDNETQVQNPSNNTGGGTTPPGADGGTPPPGGNSGDNNNSKPKSSITPEQRAQAQARRDSGESKRAKFNPPD